MEFQSYWPWEMPSKVGGTVFVADVWAATTNIAHFLTHKAARLLIVNSASIRRVKKQFPEALTIGESLDLPKNFFDVSHIPPASTNADVTGRTVIYMSNNGTRIMEDVFAKGAQDVITITFSNLPSVVSWLKNRTEKAITVVLSGEITFTDRKSMEDLYCAQALRDMLSDGKADISYYVEKSREFMISMYRKINVKRDRDFEVALQPGLYPVVPVCTKLEEGLIEITPAS
jgi:phosphosulfolactate phosphohydrolase-like enzyme